MMKPRNQILAVCTALLRTQSDKETLFRERAKYSQDGDALIHASEVIAVHFQTVAAAKNYWK